jgi:hypothetical protein
MLKIFSMKKDSKKLLFEMMEKVNPSSKKQLINEVVNPDITNLQTITQQTPAMQSANMRIDTPDEFKSAFIIFVANTGLYQKGIIKTPADVQTWVHDALVNPRFGFRLPEKK